MTMESYNLKIVLILTIGFALASILGYISQRLKLSAILGYLVAGYLIGPYSPGFVADMELSEQLAEIGVILMMFGVGMHFKWQDLVHVKNIAIPGAIGQTAIAALASTFIIYSLGWSIETGIIVGLSIGVASTVVLVRVLSDNNMLNTPQGHIAVGWLIVEDILTVIVLLLLPVFAELKAGKSIAFTEIAASIVYILLKFALLIALMFTVGRAFVKYVLFKIARTHSHELFTLTILALTFVIATGSALIFGTSIALGAFIAGMVIGQTDVKHQASANALPLKDVFVVIFFLSVGMIFNPRAIFENFPLFISVLGIILIIKPLTAFLIVWGLRYPLKTAFTVSAALAQIGEFSFILAEEALRLKIFPDEAYDIIVASALASISINPLLFKAAEHVWRRVEEGTSSLEMHRGDERAFKRSRKAIIVGFGPIGKSVALTLKKIGFIPTIIERNIDTVEKLGEEKQRAVYGDVSTPNILETAQIELADLLVLTIPDIAATIAAIKIARQINPKLHILSRVRYTADIQTLKDLDVNYVCCEEESIKAFNDAIFKIKIKG